MLFKCSIEAHHPVFSSVWWHASNIAKWRRSDNCACTVGTIVAIHLTGYSFNIHVDSQRLYTLFAFYTFWGHNLVYLFLLLFLVVFFFFFFFNPSSSKSESIVWSIATEAIYVSNHFYRFSVIVALTYIWNCFGHQWACTHFLLCLCSICAECGGFFSVVYCHVMFRVNGAVRISCWPDRELRYFHVPCFV